MLRNKVCVCGVPNMIYTWYTQCLLNSMYRRVVFVGYAVYVPLCGVRGVYGV